MAVGGLAVVRAVQRATDDAPGLAAPWFAPYVDATLTPLYPFEDPAAVNAPRLVLGFVVADGAVPCTPSWGAAYGLDAAARSIDLERRLARLREHGTEAIVSFGGAANQELATVCTDATALAEAYRSVVTRYGVDTIDLDLEGAALTDAGSLTRRAAAVATVQKERASTGKPLAVWLTLPVDAGGLTPGAQAAVTATLDAGVTLAGVNAMTMNFGDGSKARTTIERALDATAEQVRAAYAARGVTLRGDELWRRIGATPMIGLNDTAPERFDLDTASWLVSFARDRGVGRLSMWSLNRDAACGSNIDAVKPSPYCSGVEQQPRAYAALFTTFGRPSSTATTTTQPAGPATTIAATARAAQVDDPATAPYPVWNPDRSYPQGRKVVWHGNVYVALWFTHGELPDGANPTGNPVPWRLVGPVLPGERPPVTTTLAPGTYPSWDPSVAYVKGALVQLDGVGYEAKWWTKGDTPGVDVANDWDTPWQALGVDRGDGKVVAASATASPGATAPTPTTAAPPVTTVAAPAPVTTAAASGPATATTASPATTAAAAACAALPLDRTSFADGLWDLGPTARAQLDEVSARLVAGPYTSITVIGRSDRRPSAPVDNLELSRRRAEAVATYLRSQGVRIPISVDARGDRDPVASGGLDANRTVELAATC